MLSDSIFDTVEMTIRGLAQFKADGTYQVGTLLDVVDTLAEFAARGIDFDVGGDGMLDDFIDESSRDAFIEESRKRLHERFEICLDAHRQV